MNTTYSIIIICCFIYVIFNNVPKKAFNNLHVQKYMYTSCKACNAVHVIILLLYS